jgi:hypothetical protein
MRAAVLVILRVTNSNPRRGPSWLKSHFADAVRAARVKRRRLRLGDFADLAEHLARSGEIETAARPQLAQGGQHVVRAVDVRVHRGETVGETLGHETLRGQVVALVVVVTADHVKDAGIALQRGAVQLEPVEKVGDAAEAEVGRFERDAAHEPVDLVAEIEQMLRDVASVLSGDAGDQREFGHGGGDDIVRKRQVNPASRHDLMHRP